MGKTTGSRECVTDRRVSRACIITRSTYRNRVRMPAPWARPSSKERLILSTVVTRLTLGCGLNAGGLELTPADRTKLADTASPIKLQPPRSNALINLAVAGLIVTALYFAREVLVPVALAVLFSFVLGPFVIRLQSWRIPRTLSVIVAVFVGFSIIFSLGGLMVSQANRLAEELPGYQQTLREKIQGLRGVAAGGSGTLERASKVLKELDAELQSPARGQPVVDGLRRQPLDKPIPVEIRPPDPGTLTTLVAIIQPLIQPLTTIRSSS